ncbi:MAG: 3-dehydroquinate synthase [Hydrogenophilales bacterium CG17_big_fil_post_rev_8_21_14_2_50_63_12]|nr:MAG: 3-dehydroquinate synthase [Hydrogenophilales bacterium CG17_big_fil_post_rev_8_21_14_2_50_63_12]PIX97551.1 MAG: 3-dehydroquinate synthase [Hydrogenophilales bacterium CG_4_10_14_3_um_filter_63_21]PJB02770.1 MAG: 3-dehydroquinate synthase [Hydrogenophilales bacterium CG_4_9_14_3_um_filter_63_34]
MQVIEQRFTVNYTFPVIFTREVFAPDNPVLADVLRQGGHPHSQALVAIDSEVVRLNPGLLEQISQYGEAHQSVMSFVAPPFQVRGGEVCKHEPTEVERIHALVERHKICRHSFIIAIGGGAVLDAVGYAAATAHRGVRLIRLPTTVLAQNDAGIGVKNGVNAFGRKNFLGTFAPPFAVINDAAFLHSLPVRDLRAGMAEAVKVALIRDREFFDFLYEERASLSRFAPAAMEKMIFRCAELHLQHIGGGGDAFENGSSRPLDFGHWVAHKLEELSASEVKHGEAVAIGIALDSLYSRHLGILGEMDLFRILTLLETLGFALSHPALSWLDVEKALSEFREHLGGDLSIPLLEGIGRKVEAHQIDLPLMKRCIALLMERAAGKAGEGVGPAVSANTLGRGLRIA